MAPADRGRNAGAHRLRRPWLAAKAGDLHHMKRTQKRIRHAVRVSLLPSNITASQQAVAVSQARACAREACTVLTDKVYDGPLSLPGKPECAPAAENQKYQETREYAAKGDCVQASVPALSPQPVWEPQAALAPWNLDETELSRILASDSTVNPV